MKQLLFETKYWEVYLVPDQKYLGRSLVILKRDCEHLSEISKEESEDFFEIVKKTEGLFKEKFNATMFNWTCLMNNAYKKANSEKPQVHWHCRPRYEEVVEFEGKTFLDPNFAHHYLRGKENEKNVSDEFLQKMIDFLNE